MSDTTNLQKLHASLAEIGRNPELRARFIDLCRDVESALAEPERSIRDEITAPIVDALHADVGVLTKTLGTGFVFDFLYRSKIAREFVMSVPAAPSHVWEPQTTKLLSLLAGQAQHVIVGGAYFGDQAVIVAGQLRDRDGVCHAFELNSDQAAMLARNASLNGLDNIRILQLGLWDDDTTHLALVGDDSFAHPSATADDGPSVPPNTATIDGYVERAGLPSLGLIMLDIEGGELRALRGAQRQLALPTGRAPNVVFEVHRSYVDWSNGLARTQIVELVRSHGYHVFSVRDFQENRDMAGKAIELIPPESTYLEGPPHGFNMLAVKDRSIVETREFSICTGLVSPKLLMHRSPKLHHPLGGM